MNSFVKNRIERGSIITSSSLSSEDSVDSQLSKTFNQSESQFDSFNSILEDNPQENSINSQSKEKISCSECFLFLGPLILFVILIISSIVVFIIVQQRTHLDLEEKVDLNNQYLHKNFLPLLCSFTRPSKEIELAFSYNQLQCGLNRSSILQIFYRNMRYSLKEGENLLWENVLDPPKIKFNQEVLSKVSCKSFVLIMMDPKGFPFPFYRLVLHWVRYFSSTFESTNEICSYRWVEDIHKDNVHKFFLLYATNSTETAIRGKTFCNLRIEPFELEQYVTFVQLQLIASTHFHIPFIRKYN